MIDFSIVKAITIPEGSVANIVVGDNMVWRKSRTTYGNLIYELSNDKSHYSCVGVKNGVTATTITIAGSVNGLPVLEVHDGAFSSLPGVTKITFQVTPEYIGDDAFLGCDKLATIVMPSDPGILDGSPWGSGYLRPTFYIAGVKYRRHNTTSQNRYVIDGASSTFEGGKIEFVGYIGNTPVHELNEGCFKGNLKFTEIVIPDSIERVEGTVFANCTNLVKATFLGTPDYFTSTIFNGCTNLLDIYVPWAEGVKANAPWGATNATIHYNYSG